MRTLSLDEYHAELKAQGVPREDLAMICPACGGLQSARDFLAAGVKDWEGSLGFSCVGRFAGKRLEPPRPADKGPERRCNWTLGGLFKIHDLTVVTMDGGKLERHPRFVLATPEQAKAYAEKWKAEVAK